MLRWLDRNKSRSYALLALLCAVFLFAQGVVLVHDLDPATHEAGHVCEVCIPASVLGGSSVAATYAVQIVAPDRSIEPQPVALLASATVWRAHARAPPLNS